MGRERLRAHLRRLPAARRAHGRPARPPPRLHGRARALHGRARCCAGSRGAGMLIAAARCRGSAPRSSRPRRSRSSRRSSRRARSGTRRSGSGARWAAPAPPSACCSAAILTDARLGMDLLHQRADRRRRARCLRRARAARAAWTWRDAALRHRRRGHGHRGPDRARLRDCQAATNGWGSADIGRSSLGALLVTFLLIECRSKAPSCRSASSGHRTLTARTSSRSSSALDLRDVLHPLALHAAGARLLAAASRRRATSPSR